MSSKKRETPRLVERYVRNSRWEIVVLAALQVALIFALGMLAIGNASDKDLAVKQDTLTLTLVFSLALLFFGYRLIVRIIGLGDRLRTHSQQLVALATSVGIGRVYDSAIDDARKLTRQHHEKVRLESKADSVDGHPPPVELADQIELTGAKFAADVDKFRSCVDGIEFVFGGPTSKVFAKHEVAEIAKFMKNDEV